MTGKKVSVVDDDVRTAELIKLAYLTVSQFFQPNKASCTRLSSYNYRP